MRNHVWSGTILARNQFKGTLTASDSSASTLALAYFTASVNRDRDKMIKIMIEFKSADDFVEAINLCIEEHFGITLSREFE